MSDMHPATPAKTAELDAEEARFRRSRQVLVFLGATLVAMLVVALVVLVVLLSNVRETQLGGTPTGKKLLAAAERIQSCTTPGRECSEENQRRTAALIAGLTMSNEEASADAAACAAQPSVIAEEDTTRRAAAILACMRVQQESRPARR